MARRPARLLTFLDDRADVVRPGRDHVPRYTNRAASWEQVGTVAWATATILVAGVVGVA